MNEKGASQIIPVCAQYDPMHQETEASLTQNWKL